MNPIFSATASAMQADQYGLNTIGNNLANINTTGFQASDPTFTDLLRTNVDPTPTSVKTGVGTALAATQHSFTQGPLQATGSPLDIALAGPGFLPVQQANGALAYTRAGALHINSDGFLAVSSGARVAPGIQLDKNAAAISISADGVVQEQVMTAKGALPAKTVGRIQVATFTNPSGLQAVGSNLYTATAASGQARMLTPGTQGAGTLTSGYLEGSNVDLTTEMTSMLITQRAFAANAKVEQMLDQMYSQATQMHA